MKNVKSGKYTANLDLNMWFPCLLQKNCEVVAMDLKIFGSSIILHLVDHVTRFSAAAVVKSKDRNEIIKHLFRTWISIFGAPPKFFSDVIMAGNLVMKIIMRCVIPTALQ